MLMLARNVGETIRIGPDIVVTVSRIGNSSVWLGVDAPRDVQILRDDAIITRPKESSPCTR